MIGGNLEENMKKKRILAVLLSLMMVLALMPSAVWAEASATEQYDGETLNAIAAQLQDPSNDPFDYTSPRVKARSAAKAYPAAYDLRDLGCVTPVKFQNPFGTCWGFAAIAAAESSILGSGLAAHDGYDAESLDLSEKHLVYFVSQAISDPSDSQYGEGTHAADGVSVRDQLNGGGMPFMATSLFASGMGPVLEARSELLEYKGRNGWTEKRTIDGRITDFCYDDEDDWSLPEEYRFIQSYVLKESYMLPSPAQIDEKTNEYTYNPSGTEAIKEMLMNRRAVQIGFCADTSSPSQEAGDGVYISKNWAHYTYDATESANHAVTIVGWDDNYPKENFVEGHNPPENGAWLVKNSWGSAQRDFPNKGPGWGIEDANGVNTGYFWLSYYDKTISLPEALEFDRSNVGSGYYLDEYDFMPVNDVSAAEVPNEIRMSNVFKAEVCEMLEQVSCETTYPGTKVVNEVYLLADDFTSPTDGVLVDRTESTFGYGGFHKIDLESPDIIQKGQYYSIVQTQTTPEGNYALNMPIAMGEEFSKAMGYSTWIQGVVNEKESYLYMDGKWYDYSDSELKAKLFGKSYLLMSFDNFPIKGYCSEKSNINIRVSGNKMLSLNEGEDASVLRVIYKGDAGSAVDSPKITWKLAEGGDEIITLTPDASATDRASIRAVKPGRTNLYVTVPGIGTTVASVSVDKISISGLMIREDKFVYNGKPHKPKVVVYDAADNVVSQSHYTVTYKNNIKCGEADVAVKVKAGDKMYKGTQNIDFCITPRRAKIKSMSAGTGSLTVRVKNQKPSGVKTYQVYYRIKGSSKWLKKSFKASSGTSLCIKGLSKGKRYQVKVRAAAGKHNSLINAGKFSPVRTSKRIK